MSFPNENLVINNGITAQSQSPSMSYQQSPTPVPQQPATQTTTVVAQTPQLQLNIQTEFDTKTFQAWIDILVDSNATEETKLNAAVELNYNLEIIQSFPTFSQFIDDATRKFLRVLNETEPQFITESTIQQLRKKILEIIHRSASIVINNSTLMSAEQRALFFRDILLLVFRLVEKENEENVLICLRIISDYYKHFKSTLNSQVHQFFKFVKNFYRDLLHHLLLIFNYKPQLKVNDISELNLDHILQETYTSFQILIEKTNPKENQIYNVIPRGSMSLKVLADCPMSIVMFCHAHKVHQNAEISELINYIANVIALQPTEQQRLNPDNKEVYVEFVTAQVKALSLIAYINIHHKVIFLSFFQIKLSLSFQNFFIFFKKRII
jgi:transformation/transcription domain-associated protein